MSFEWRRMKCTSTLLCGMVMFLLPRVVADQVVEDEWDKPFPLINPKEGHTKLELDPSGVAALQRIKGPIAPVIVIGPYRSGKSFLLNQLLEVPCDKGFGVGHLRDTQTKGIWVWGSPKALTVDGESVSVVYVDTEGFESTGKTEAYDDRIFALSAIIGSVLVYNLPETVKEVDIEKLSFASELAEEFFSRVQGREAAFHPAALLWLIQRDFLKGKSVQEMVREALAPVPNPRQDKSLDNVNRVRNTLLGLSQNATAFGLRQPHLDRTNLCNLPDSALDQDYVRQRGELKQLVRSLVRPKLAGGKQLDGAGLAELLGGVVEALNQGDIPMLGSLVQLFNRDVVAKCTALYDAQMARLGLPLGAADVEAAHGAAVRAAEGLLDKERFGREEATVADLRKALQAARERVEGRNELASARECEAAEAGCEAAAEALQGMALPSARKFDHRLAACNATFAARCRGPSEPTFQEKLGKAAARERGRFLESYNARLLNGLVIASVCGVVAARLVLRSSLVELASWAAFAFLQVYPKMMYFPGAGGGGGTFYDSRGWLLAVQVWEAVAYNEWLDLEAAGPIALAALLALYILYRARCTWRRWREKKPPPEEKDVNV